MHQPSTRRTAVRAVLVLGGAALMLTGALPAQSMPEPSSSSLTLLRAPLPTVSIAPTARVASTGVRLTFTASPIGLPSVARTVLLQARRGTGLWKTVATTRWSGRGAIKLSYVPTLAAAYQYRTVIAAGAGLRAVVGRVIPFTVRPTTNRVGLSQSGGVKWDLIKAFRFSVSAPSGVDLRTVATRKVNLQVRHRGATTWTNAGLATTGLNGVVAFNLKMLHSGQFEARAVLKAAPGMPSSVSAVIAYSVSPGMVMAGVEKSTPVGKEALGVGGLLGAAVPEQFGSVRIWDAGVAWKDIETRPNTDPSTWNWAKLDGIVADAERKGQKLLYAFASTPRFYAADPDAVAMVAAPTAYPLGASQPPTRSGAVNLNGTGVSANGVGDAAMDSYRRFATAVVKRYKGRMDSYQSWNETNLSDFWQGTAEQAAELTKILDEVQNAEDPDALTVTASIATRSAGAFFPFIDDYLTELGKRGWPGDVFSAHFYPKFSWGVTEVMRLEGMFKRVLADAGAPDKPIWNTEINYRTNGNAEETAGLIAKPLTDSQIRTTVGQIYIRSLSAGIARTYWYGWIKPPTSCTSFCLGVPLWTDTTATKAMGQLAVWLATPGAEAQSIEGCTTNAANLTSCRLTMKGGTHKYIVWSEATTSTFSSVGGAKVTGTHTLAGDALRYAAGLYTATTEPALVDVA